MADDHAYHGSSTSVHLLCYLLFLTLWFSSDLIPSLLLLASLVAAFVDLRVRNSQTNGKALQQTGVCPAFMLQWNVHVAPQTMVGSWS